MEAVSHSGIARWVQPSLGTSALFLSYVFVEIIIYYGMYNMAILLSTTHTWMGVDVRICAAQVDQLLQHVAWDEKY
jgi:hypothetical protein